MRHCSRQGGHILRKTLYASRDFWMAVCTSRELAVLTLASNSPVVGHVDCVISPEPFHCPSYTPFNSPDVGSPSACKIFDARVDKVRVKWLLKDKWRLDNMSKPLLNDSDA